MLKNVSGQAVYFTLVSAISGNPVTGASGSISGRKSLDLLSGMIVLSGNIIELGGGSYRANLYSEDCNGNQVGFLFSASGCVPVQYQFDMIDGNGSGRFFMPSGLPLMDSSGFLKLASGSLSGFQTTLVSGASFLASGGVYLASGSVTSGVISSGIFVSVPIASISGAIVNSGLFVTVPIATISGTIVNSGLFVTVPIATISGVIANSGIFVTVPIATISGLTANSGLFVTVPKATISGVIANSGLNVVATTYSGTTFLPSGLPIFDVNGNTYAILADGVAHAGFNASLVLQQAIVQNGAGNAISINATGGDAIKITGPVELNDLTVSGTISAVSNFIPWSPLWNVPASGITVVLPKASISGVIANSGLFVTVPIDTISGAVANSGLFASVLKATLSGIIANSGLNVIVNDKSGYSLSPAGLDTVQVESGFLNVRQSLAVAAAACGGQLSGAGTGTIHIDGANVSGTERIRATTNASGNRTAVVLTLP